MKVIRSSKCSLKFSNKEKLSTLDSVLKEYGRVVNLFIDQFWPKPPKNNELLKPVVDSVLPTWLSARLRKVAAREAISMVKANVERDGEKAVKPTHRGHRMVVSSTIAELQKPKKSNKFDRWLHLTSIGNKVKLDLPIKLHKHFNLLYAKGKRLNAYVITKDYVQFAFEIETGKKRTEGSLLGIDTGIKALASISDGRQLGLDIESCVERIKRCAYGSKGQKRARRDLKQRMDEVAKEVFSGAEDTPRLVVVEKLKNLNKNSKIRRRLNSNMRRSLGSWAYRYWLDRVQRECEVRRSTFRSVNPAYTSQRCAACGHTERANRSGTVFLCRSCGHTDNADLNAARNIVERFVSGPYGAGFQPLVVPGLA